LLTLIYEWFDVSLEELRIHRCLQPMNGLTRLFGAECNLVDEVCRALATPGLCVVRSGRRPGSQQLISDVATFLCVGQFRCDTKYFTSVSGKALRQSVSLARSGMFHETSITRHHLIVGGFPESLPENCVLMGARDLVGWSIWTRCNSIEVRQQWCLEEVRRRGGTPALQSPTSELQS
jgi:hypothetical protein